ncbi:metal-dependent hydrolase [Candidatus Woesearchaeota archaeon]|nr:metal-dependent hydrolase [Candidatus Woesearchaeota archaeon]
MALAVTHIILTIVVLDLLRHYVFGKKKFPRHLIVIGGIAGLLPDIDVILTWGYNFLFKTDITLHGTFTHSLLWPIAAIVIGTILYFYNKKDKIKIKAKIAYVIAFGLFSHILLDCLYGGYKTFFWPLSLNIISSGFCPNWGIHNHATSIDAVILVIWLVHEDMHNYIKDYF